MISEGMTLRDFADKLGVKSRDLIKPLFERGIMANINHVLEPELAQKLAAELGVETMVVTFEEEVQLQAGDRRRPARPQAEGRVRRARPVVTIMGHVDHGKTSLLDAIRSSKVTDGEFGGITQHIGAYHVDVNDRKIVFLDTPGHEAFTMMRARGAKVTDIVVLVVAADDGVMPQTIEAIDHARAAKVPIVVAINKIDKPNANLDRVKKELADRGLLPEDWGGETVTVPVSALKKEGINELLEMILLTADMLELKASPEIPAQGVVLEARKEVGRGIVATVLVQNGTLKVGDVFVSGATWGRVRSMSDDRGKRARRSRPVDAGRGHRLQRGAGRRRPVPGGRGRGEGAHASPSSASQEQRKRELAPTQGAPVARAALQPDPGGRGQGAAGGAQGRRAGLGRGAARHARPSSSTDKVKVNVHPRRGRRDLDQRRAARLGLQGDHRRLQRPARAQRRRARREGRRRHPAPHRHLRARSTSCARR